MRIQGVALGVVLLAFLVGCGNPTPTPPSSSPSVLPSPTPETAPVGEAAIPLGCSDILADADVADLGHDSYDRDIHLAIDEDRIVVDMTAVVALEAGTLHCVWAARYGATDFHAQISLRISPSTSTALDPATEESSVDVFTPVDGDPNTLIACYESFEASSDDPTLFNGCEVIKLTAGYRVELETSALKAAAGRDQTATRSLLTKIDAAIASAGPARAIPDVEGTTNPAALCTSPEIAPLLEYLGAVGDPMVTSSNSVTTCAWEGVDEYGNDIGPWVHVLPGGAWAIPRLVNGESNIFLPTHPSSDGNVIVGVGDGVSAWRAIGDDLVSISSYDFDATTGWEAVVEATW